MAPRSLLAIIDTAQVSGPGRQLAALLRELRQRGTDARVLTFHRAGRPASPFVPFLEAAGIPVTVVPERARFDPAVVGHCRRLVRDFRPDIIQTHSYKATVVAWRLRRTGERFGWVGCFHGTTAETLAVRLYHWLDLRLLRGADQVVLMAEAQRKLLGRFGGRAVVIHNAVLPPASPGPAAAAGPCATFAYVGRLSPEKGVDLLLQAVAILCREAPGEDWSLLVAGHGPEREALERQAQASGITSRVSFLGQVADPWQVYRRVACVVLPSRSEGLPNVLLESIVADRAVVATAVGAVPEVLGGTAAGEMPPAHDAAALAAAMRRALAGGRSTAAIRARAAIAEQFSLARRVAAHLAVYQSVLAARAEAPR